MGYSLETFVGEVEMNNRYPRGKLNESDEGSLRISVGLQENIVVINFFKDISWIGLDKEAALSLAEAIVHHANNIVVN